MGVRLPEPILMADYLFTNYFLNEVLRKRPSIKPEWCVFVIENAVHFLDGYLLSRRLVHRRCYLTV